MSKAKKVNPEGIPSPIKPRSKNEILADMKKNADFKRRMAFVKEKFWPALCESAENIKDAQMLMEGFNTQIMQSFLGKMKEVKLSDLKLEAQLDQTSPKYPEHLAMLKLFEDMSVFNAKDLIEGMREEINLFVTDELAERPLSSLKTRWVDEL